MLNTKLKLYDVWQELFDTDFIVGVDDFNNVSIDSTQITGFWYFRNSKKGVIKHFVLEQTEQTEKRCSVTLIKKTSGKFTPRFSFEVWNTTQKALNNFSKDSVDQNLIKAKVDLSSCYDKFLLLLNFIKEIGDVDFECSSYAVVDKSKIDIFENITKEVALTSFVGKYGESITEQDIALLQKRRSKLDYFSKLLDDTDFFEKEKNQLGENKRVEDVWQNFFENNSWIFGYGLQLVACEGLDDRKLEQIIVGNDILTGAGKRIDALLKTKGSISKLLFCEIKTHLPNLLIEPYERPGVYVPGKELRGAVAQIQKTIHKATLKIHDNYCRPTDTSGEPTGEELLFVKPRGIVVIGKLDDFKTVNGINYEQLSSFEMYRQQISGIEILTFDELYERVKYIIEK